jgi:uncharacterized protein (TIGR01627 family)
LRLERLRRALPQPARRRLRAQADRLAAWRGAPRGETDLTCDDVPPLRLDYQRPAELRGRPIGFGPVRVLSVEPPVFLCGIPYDQFQGFAPAFGKRYGQRPAGFLIVPTWSVEAPEVVDALVEGHYWHRERFPEHRLRYLCNSAREVELLQGRGMPAILLNHKFTVSEEVFRPRPDIAVEFDAVYNARFVPDKRHELAAQVPSVAYVTYVEAQRSRQRDYRRLRPRILSAGERHILLNEIDGGLPASMSHADVNACLARASVGLLLSEVEGASYAAVEYLLAGLPVVSTPSLGGREAYFDDEFCIVCEPTPVAVRDAVAELKARQIPREHVRAVTLAKLTVQRERLLDERDSLVRDLGGAPAVRGDWPFSDVSGVPWATFNSHLAAFERRQKEELAAQIGMRPSDLADIQLSARELRTVIEAVAARPGGSLLVFGPGNDSLLWERVNAAGTTAFIESDAGWADRVRRRLTSAEVHHVDFTTRCGDWERLLDHPEELPLDLPADIRSRQWDVVLVDGPPGYAPSLPGRMSSIFEASRLVGPGGRVFVHDVERDAEAAFASRYLGDDRCVVRVRGRAELAGYDR